MRLVAAPAQAVLGGQLALVLLVDLLLDTPLYFCTAAVDIEHAGRTYLGIEQLQVSPLSEVAGEVQQLSYTLPAVPNEYLGLALGTLIRGKQIVLQLAILSPDTQAILDVQPLWRGEADQMPVRYGPETAAIAATAEHRAVAFARPKPLRYTDADQRRLFPGDRCLEYLIAQSQAQDTWPSREWFRQ